MVEVTSSHQYITFLSLVLLIY